MLQGRAAGSGPPAELVTRFPELGLGALELLSNPGVGRVAGVYSNAAYLSMPGGLVALTSFDVHSGPVHARSGAPLGNLRVGDKVVVTSSLLQSGPVLLELDRASVWRGEVPAAEELASGRRLCLELLQEAPAPAVPLDLVSRTSRQLEEHDLVGAARTLGGVGPGLTPAGDDCLAGILLVRRIFGAEPPETLEKVASQVETNDVSYCFLRWAARGQAVEPVHRFLLLASAGDPDGARVALKELTAVGHSSGADIALGLKLGLEAK
jgi:hypothetical protein